MATALWAFGFLFFIQLFTLYIESMYRLSLTKLSMGMEMWGLVFLLAPLPLLLLGRFGERYLPRIAIAGLVVTRCIAPYLGARAQIINSGIGVACFLILLCYTFAGSPAVPRADWMSAIVLAMLGSIVLRSSVWATYDLSLYPVGFLPAAAVFAGLLAWAWTHARRERDDTFASPSVDNVEAPASIVQSLAASLVFFATIVLLYLIVSSPGVISAWSGSSYPVVIVITTIAWFTALYFAKSVTVGKGMLACWNLLFFIALVTGILANTVTFPSSPDAPVTVTGRDQWWQHAPLYFMLFLSPVLAFNLAMAMQAPRTTIRKSAFLVSAGSLLLLVLPILLILSNVWGYVQPVSPMMRNKFYLPFALAGALILLGITLSQSRTFSHAPSPGKSWARRVATVLCVVFLVRFGYIQVLPARNAISVSTEPIQQLRVLTYNYQQGSELNGDQCYRGQMRFIGDINPDIVLLQESDTPRPSGGNVDSPRLFAESLGYRLYFGPKTVTGTFGTAILSRFPLENPRTIFTYSEEDEVGTAVAEIVVNGRRIVLLNNHPDGGDAVKHAHIDALIAEAKRYEHALAAGDFNSRQSSPYYAKLSAVLRDSWLSLYPNAVGDADSVLGGDASDASRFDMSERIDHIFASDTFKAVDAHYILRPDSLTDHPAYWCTLHLE
ncbi:MAG: endonuclease/exonuclease/phosphatase family protein [Candidatus Hydrogenedentales bacterium]|jgi:endonuclease/exonuclease/phosphatase family metal-dependent hydrolase